MSAKLIARLTRKPKPTKELPMPRPPCFDTQVQFNAWLEESRVFAATANVNPKNYCLDCLPETKESMCRQNRCGYPEVTFVKSGGGIYGKRPPKAPTRTKG